MSEGGKAGTALVAQGDTKPKCGAKTRSGGKCRKPAGHRTDHPGQGRCHLHGGLTPIRHGRYSSVQRRSVRELVAKFEADPNPLDTLPELALARALLADYLERAGKGRVPFDPHDAMQLVAEISKAVKRIEDVRSAEHVSRGEFYRVLQELGRVVDLVAREFITDQATCAAFLERVHSGWLGIRLA